MQSKDLFSLHHSRVANVELSFVSHGWVWLCSRALIQAGVLNITLFLRPCCSLLGYAYCSYRWFCCWCNDKHCEKDRSPLRGKWMSTEDCLKIIASEYKEGDCWIASNDTALRMEETTFSLVPTAATLHTREAALRPAPVANKVVIWCANATDLKTWCREAHYGLHYLLRDRKLALIRNSWVIFSTHCQ